MKKIIALFAAVLLIVATLTGCSGGKGSSKVAKEIDETVLILGFTEPVMPFLDNEKPGNAGGFIPELWAKIFDSVKGDFKSYRFEQVEKGYELEKDGGFKGTDGKDYSASLLVGAVHKNDGTFNEDYSYTAPIVTNRVIAVVKKESPFGTYASFSGARVLVTNETAKTALEKNAAIAGVCASVNESGSLDEALAALDGDTADVVITDEFTLMPSDKKDNYTVVPGELDTIEYVIACAKYSGWKDSINEAIKELKSEDYGEGDEFTPIVETYFGYNASSFEYVTDGDKS